MSRGRLALQSADPFRQARIEPRYFSEAHDREVIVSGLEMLREIYRQPAFGDLWEAETLPGPEVRTRADLWKFASSRGGDGVPSDEHLPDGER